MVALVALDAKQIFGKMHRVLGHDGHLSKVASMRHLRFERNSTVGLQIGGSKPLRHFAMNFGDRKPSGLHGSDRPLAPQTSHAGVDFIHAGALDA